MRVVSQATDWGSPSDETGKTEVPCHSRCGTIKIPPCLKALSAEHRPKFCSPSPAMVKSPYKWTILNNQSINWMLELSLVTEFLTFHWLQLLIAIVYKCYIIFHLLKTTVWTMSTDSPLGTLISTTNCSAYLIWKWGSVQRVWLVDSS
jgi:hypothetical protein